MDTAQWPQEIVVKPIEEIVVTNNSCAPKPANINNGNNNLVERKTRPHKEQALSCPRCNSTNTKFCYYNNYSLTQPRYFCKTCRRYWTDGGSLRNIPVGGGSRKNKRSASNSSSSSNSASSKSKLPDLVTHHQNPNKIHDHQGQDLNLAFSNSINHETNETILSPTTTATNTTLNHNNHQLSALELITGISSRGLNSFMPMNAVQDPNTVYTSGFPILNEFKLPTTATATLNFSLDHGLGTSVGDVGYGSSCVLQDVHQDQHTSSSTTNGRLLFPFEDLKQVSSTNSDIEQNRDIHGDSTGYWTGMLGGGSW